MEFMYFKGPRTDMSGLLEGRNTCSICNNEQDYCFNLEYTAATMCRLILQLISTAASRFTLGATLEFLFKMKSIHKRF